jgi:hypothetical protein
MPRLILYGSCLRGYKPNAHGLRPGLTKWIIWQIIHKRKSANLYRILPIIHDYNVGISWLWPYARLQSEDAILVICLTPIICPTSVRRYDSGRISRPRSHFSTLVDVMTLVVSPDSDHTSRLRSMSVPHILPPQLWKTLHGRVRWQHHLANQKFSRKQTGRDAWLDQRSKHQYLTASHAQVVSHEPRDQRALNLGWSERNRVSKRTRYPCNSGGSRSSNAWSGEPSLYVARPWH